MDRIELRELSTKVTAEDLLQLLQDFINKGGDTRLRRLLTETRTLQDWHPTLQQCLMRDFIKPAIVALADDPRPDDRNRGTVRMCKEILHILEKHKLPFI